MSDSQSFLLSSPLSTSGHRRRSRFTYRHLAQLAASSTTCPLRVIAHIDLDAFYAQCEAVRLGLAEDQPLAVQQWAGLIAVNYPARAFGLTRFIDIGEAKKLCPHAILQHVATWKEGDEKWAYHPDASHRIDTHKVSLDPYRLESRKILALIKDHLPALPLQRVEKAGIDEVFLDLSAHIHSILLERYPELGGPPPCDDPTENLPRPTVTALDWQIDALVDLNSTETEDDDPDWDDIAMLIGSEIVRGVRAEIRARLRYTSSAGLARNKMLSKLGSAHKKPNGQTIVRNRAVQQFLAGFKYTKIRNLGGKLGEQAVSVFGTNQVKELLEVPLEQLRSKLGHDAGSWLYGTIRGEDNSEVSPRTQIKSMLSAKSFRPSINTYEQAVGWLRIFIADIFSRLVEEGVLVNKRRPRTMNLHHRQGGTTRSRQMPIPQGKAVDEPVLFELAKTLLGQLIGGGRAWPCAHLSLSVGGFEDGVTGNKGIGGFLVKGEEAKAMLNSNRQAGWQVPRDDDHRPAKRSRIDDAGISRFFARREPSRDEHDDENPAASDVDEHADPHPPRSAEKPPADDASSLFLPSRPFSSSPRHPRPTTLYTCPKCASSLPSARQAEHEDWHFAKTLQAEDRAVLAGHRSAKPTAPRRGPKKKPPPSPPPPGGDGGRTGEKGQRKLVFDER